MNICNVRCLAVLLLAVSAQALNGASININFVDSFGNAVPFKVKQFKQCCSDIGRDYANRFRGSAASGLPNMSYNYELVPNDPIRFEPLEGQVFLSGENTFITVEARVNHGGVDFSGFTLYGRIVPSGPVSGKRSWVRLLSPYGADWTWDAQADKMGRFIIDGIRERGNYVVVVCNESGIVAVAAVTIHNGRNAVVINAVR